jgi:hypothetical protein
MEGVYTPAPEGCHRVACQMASDEDTTEASYSGSFLSQPLIHYGGTMKHRRRLAGRIDEALSSDDSVWLLDDCTENETLRSHSMHSSCSQRKIKGIVIRSKLYNCTIGMGTSRNANRNI